MNAIPSPGIFWGSYPERQEPRPPAPRRLGTSAYRQQVAASRAQLQRLMTLDEPAFTAHVVELRSRLARRGLCADGIAEGLATASEAIRREFGLSIYDTQLFAAAVILDNRLAEMATGEGKTISALLAAATGAMAGIPVHVLTANDYLVARDAARLAPAYARLGLAVGAVTQDITEDARRQAYARPVCYVTAKELVFDYLRDSLRQGGRHTDLARRARFLEGTHPAPLLQGLCMAVLDEADSLLIDEAQMPLILSRQESDPASRSFHWQALMLADRLSEGRDFRRPPGKEPISLTEHGRRHLASLAHALGGRWRSARVREDVIGLALAARHSFRRDRDYLIRDDKLEIIDEITGRTAPGRVWSRGLHALIELKEGCKPSPETRTLARITYQRFFPRYLRLGGMSGTLTEAHGELREIYALPVVRVPLRTPCVRQNLPPRLFTDPDSLWTAVAERVRTLRAKGRPVLIGTASVGESEALSAHLTKAGIPHQVLNARCDEKEAEIVAQAGMAGLVTVTTNMAGRGTDIPLGPGVAAAGGLHVLCCQHNASHRIDRQLQGRCARQGDPGSTETWLAIDQKDSLLSDCLKKYPGHTLKGEIVLPKALLNAAITWQQKKRAARQRQARRLLLQADCEWEQGLAFRGRSE